MSVLETFNHMKYLGLPSLIGRNKMEIFSFINDRVWIRVHSWKNKLLSMADKEILIKTIAQSIPTYTMSVFLLPLSLCDDIEKIFNSFW